MAERRMFSKSIIDSDLFLDMPATTQMLYFHLAMNADDDGLSNKAKRIMRMIGASDDDMRILIVKQFVILFESGVIAITHWHVHNSIRQDRCKSSMLPEKNMLYLDENMIYHVNDGCQPVDNQMTTNCQPNGNQLPTNRQPSDNHLTTSCQPSDNQMTTNCQPNDGKWLPQDRIGKDRIGKDRIDNSSATAESAEAVPFQQIINLYHEICTSYPKVQALSDKRKKAIKARFRVYGLDGLQKVFKKAEKSQFLKGCNNRNWSANFDWILKEDNFIKIMEGKYDGNREHGHNYGYDNQCQYTSVSCGSVPESATDGEGFI